jgi:hypothetical protein
MCRAFRGSGRRQGVPYLGRQLRYRLTYRSEVNGLNRKPNVNTSSRKAGA